MQADTTYPETTGAAPEWGAALWFQMALGAVLALVSTLVWLLTGLGYFWPMWVWFALIVILGLQTAIFVALLLAPEDPERGLAAHLAVTGSLSAALVLLWLLT